MSYGSPRIPFFFFGIVFRPPLYSLDPLFSFTSHVIYGNTILFYPCRRRTEIIPKRKTSEWIFYGSKEENKKIKKFRIEGKNGRFERWTWPASRCREKTTRMKNIRGVREKRGKRKEKKRLEIIFSKDVRYVGGGKLGETWIHVYFTSCKSSRLIYLVPLFLFPAVFPSCSLFLS